MKVLLSTLLTLLILFIILIAGITFWVYRLSEGLPDDRVIKSFTPDAITIIYDKDGRTLTSLKEDKDQIWVPLTGISVSLQEAVIASEDPYFLRHGGIDYRQTWESVKDNLRSWRWVRGGSTITQQVAKNVFLSGEKTITRKIKEYFLAKKMERLLPKERIFEMYLNEAGWGYGIYGAELASRFYLDKHASELNYAEAALLAAMLRNPAHYNPHKNIERAKKRRQLVLMLMQRHNFLTMEEYNNAISYTIALRRDKLNRQFTNIGLGKQEGADNTLPCYANLIEGYLIKTFGRDLLYNVGLEVKTTIDDIIQDKVEDVIASFNKEGVGIPAGDIQIGLISDDRDIVRAIGCTGKWKEAAEKIRGIGAPFDSYKYTATQEKEIDWKDILLVDTGGGLM